MKSPKSSKALNFENATLKQSPQARNKPAARLPSKPHRSPAAKPKPAAPQNSCTQAESASDSNQARNKPAARLPSKPHRSPAAKPKPAAPQNSCTQAESASDSNQARNQARSQASKSPKPSSPAKLLHSSGKCQRFQPSLKAQPAKTIGGSFPSPNLQQIPQPAFQASPTEAPQPSRSPIQSSKPPKPASPATK